MNNSSVRVFPDLQVLNRQAASRFTELAGIRTNVEGIFTCALSGGSTPRRLYELLGDPEYQIPWKRVHLFQVDERTVPPDDPESNYRMIRESLLSRASIPEANFHRMLAESLDLGASAGLYSDEIRRVLRPGPNEWPRFDLVLLGMGNDGHTASLFPSSPALTEQERWVTSNYSPSLGKHRLTLTFPVLNAAAEIIFLVSGGDKAETLRSVLEGPAGVFPAQSIRPANGQLTWFVDEAAARLLKRPPGSGA